MPHSFVPPKTTLRNRYNQGFNLDVERIDQLNAVLNYNGYPKSSNPSKHPRACHNLLGYTPNDTSVSDRRSVIPWVSAEIPPADKFLLFRLYGILNQWVADFEADLTEKAKSDQSARELLELAQERYNSRLENLAHLSYTVPPEGSVVHLTAYVLFERPHPVVPETEQPFRVKRSDPRAASSSRTRVPSSSDQQSPAVVGSPSGASTPSEIRSDYCTTDEEDMTREDMRARLTRSSAARASGSGTQPTTSVSHPPRVDASKGTRKGLQEPEVPRVKRRRLRLSEEVEEEEEAQVSPPTKKSLGFNLDEGSSVLTDPRLACDVLTRLAIREDRRFLRQATPEQLRNNVAFGVFLAGHSALQLERVSLEADAESKERAGILERELQRYKSEVSRVKEIAMLDRGERDAARRALESAQSTFAREKEDLSRQLRQAKEEMAERIRLLEEKHALEVVAAGMKRTGNALLLILHT